MKKVAALLLAGTMVMSLAACSGKSDTKTTTAAEETTETTAETTAETKAGETVAEGEMGPIFKDLKENGVLKVGIIGNDPTFCFHTVVDGKDELAGFEVAGMYELSLIHIQMCIRDRPYDSTPAQWKRYTDLCGPIDEEIFTPELVKEGSLCPHQDYVYFNWPKDDEIRVVKEYTQQTKAVVEELSHDREFIRMIANHRGILAPEEYSEDVYKRQVLRRMLKIRFI